MKFILFVLFALMLNLGSGFSAHAQDKQEAAYAKAYLTQLQSYSFQYNKEYCGYFGYDQEGKIAASKPRRGRTDSCQAFPPSHLDIFASYHTHAGFDIDADNEVPSANDLYADQEEGIDGYVATPGGPLWFIDGRRLQATLICGVNCVEFDPRFKPRVLPCAK